MKLIVKKEMKKIIIFITTVTICLSISACDTKKSPSDSQAETSDISNMQEQQESIQVSGEKSNIQDEPDIVYSNNRNDFASDAVFTNFRDFACGKMKKNTFYRSASPCDNQLNRASYADKLIKDAGVNFIMDLSDSKEDIREHIDTTDFNSPYFLSLYKEGNVIALAMESDYKGADFKAKVAEGFSAMSKADGPYLIHCVEGRDRTGFVCMLLEALANATYQEIVDDYMSSYENYYGINKETDKEKYEAIKKQNIDEMLKYISGVKDDAVLETIDFSKGAKKYLLDAGMKEKDLDRFVKRISQ